jgi:hypothetical protein
VIAPPPAGRWVWGRVSAEARDESTRLVHLCSGVELYVRGGRLRPGTGYAAAAGAERRELARAGAIVRLRRHGKYLVHASGVVDSRRRAWLLTGDSGAGKSTLAFSLARAGWGVLGDDGVVLEPSAGGILVHAWRAPLMVSRALRPQFPELGEEHVHDREDPRERVAVTSVTRASRALLSGVLLVHRRPADASPVPIPALTRARPLEALSALVRQSPWVSLDDAHASAHLLALGRAAALPAWHLHNEPARLADLDALLQAVAP